MDSRAAAKAAETAVKRQCADANKRREVGLSPITDVHEARATYDSARANTIAQRNALADAYQALTEITGTRITNLQGLPDDFRPELPAGGDAERSEEHTSELQSLMRISYAVFCLTKKNSVQNNTKNTTNKTQKHHTQANQ